jgi:hypothetical protein
MSATNWAVVNNGLDFLGRAVTEMASDDEAEEKYAAKTNWRRLKVRGSIARPRTPRDHGGPAFASRRRRGPRSGCERMRTGSGQGTTDSSHLVGGTTDGAH